ncbi:polyphosphate kinase 1 [uncultured Faecalibaculum sp.]|uniref:polyphosphate kinase 1 n=1 Tax=uncultured Faecalibaculum sp. TaxID=1729681 RepID=UPI0025E261E0|nr:polyphosphate kinase 1 [uncultured Faecalibaculum sp.]
MEEKRYPFTQNREISWLRFNQRVLEEASDPRVPLLERLKFLSIFTSNLDEFFMVRCGSLYDQMLFDPDRTDAKSGMTPKEQLQAIYKDARRLYAMRDTVYKDINKTLQALFLANVSRKNLSRKQQKSLQQEFEHKILPLLSPQIIDAHHPFPHLINKEQYIFCELQMTNGKKRFGIIPVPSFLDRVIPVPDTSDNYILVEQLILQHVDKVFPKSRVLFKTIIRVTRNADINLNEKDIEEDEDYRQYMKKILKKRSRLSAIRLELYKGASPEVLSYLCSHLRISPEQVFVSRVPLELKHLFQVVSGAPASRTAPLLYQPFVPQSTTQLDPDRPLIPQIAARDVMLFYPYQDIGLYLKLLKEAAWDKNVVSIKITIYRLADNSKVVDYLVQAAENGKEVLVLMELRARFDESNNIRMAERLENAGCTVIYGFENYKVHSKICLITYRSHGQIRTITQIGTGNYNEKTSRQYTDLSLMTGDPVIGQDAIAFFQNMQISNLNGAYRKLLTSPQQLKTAVMEKIDRQIQRAKEGQPARIMLKMNSVTDLELIEKLQQASQAGVPVTMVVRGICCLLPGIEGQTENIRIYSIVGRFLEHSRIYVFGPDEDMEMYISSADFMTRNTERRVEIAAPVTDPALRRRVMTYFDSLLKDNQKRRELKSDGRYLPIDLEDNSPYDSQAVCIREAEKDRFVPEVPRGFMQRLRNRLRHQS